MVLGLFGEYYNLIAVTRACKELHAHASEDDEDTKGDAERSARRAHSREERLDQHLQPLGFGNDPQRPQGPEYAEYAEDPQHCQARTPFVGAHL